MHYAVNELFESIQGEGFFTGTPATFVRLQGCDVGCPWCDTKHTWSAGSPGALEEIVSKFDSDERAVELTEEEILAAIQGFRPRHVVLTGGEPAAQDLAPLVELLTDRGYTVQIETSGTYKLPWFLDDPWITVSPKVGMKRPLQPETIQRASEIKMPVGRERDLESLMTEVLPMVRWGTPVFLQPLSQSKTATALCVEWATEKGWRVSPQMHKFLGLP